MIIQLRCPACNTPIGEIDYVGTERTKCRNKHCGVRLFIQSNGESAGILMIDKAPAVLSQLR